MRKLLNAAALCLALPLALSLSGCGATVDGHSFNPTSNNSDGTAAEGGPDAADPPPAGLEPGSPQLPIPSTGSGAGSTQPPAAGSGPPQPPQPSTGPVALSISGTPAGHTAVGAAYTFTPVINESTSTVTFKVSHVPAWLRFNASTGTLSGTPTAADIGTYPEIVVSASDQQSSVSLAPFAIEVDPASGRAALTWTPPTTNVDGSPVAQLAGYAVAFGRSSGVLDQLITVNDASATSYTVEGLEPGVWYFSVRAVALTGTESAYSNIATTQID